MSLQLHAHVARKQVTKGRFRPHDLFERGKHDQTFRRQQLPESRPNGFEFKFAVAVVLQDPAVMRLQQLRDGLTVVIRRLAAPGHVQAG
ncbi:hypothetical protein D3C87_1412760 [compost metagenome]